MTIFGYIFSKAATAICLALRVGWWYSGLPAKVWLCHPVVAHLMTYLSVPAVAVAGDFLGSTVLDNASAFPLCHFSVHNGVSTLVQCNDTFCLPFTARLAILEAHGQSIVERGILACSA